MTHAEQRVAERLTEAGVAAVKQEALFKLAKLVAKKECKQNEAIAARIWVVEGQVGQAWSDRSNGDQVWAIIRGGYVVTVMLRRHTQPSTAEALKVDRVVIIK